MVTYGVWATEACYRSKRRLLSAKNQSNMIDLSKFLAFQSKLFRASDERIDISERKKILYGLMTIRSSSFAIFLKRQHFIDSKTHPLLRATDRIPQQESYRCICKVLLLFRLVYKADKVTLAPGVYEALLESRLKYKLLCCLAF